MRLRHVAMLLTVTGLAALPASAAADDFVAPPPPSFDSLTAFGTNSTFNLTVKASNNRLFGTTATGGFVFKALNADIEVSGDATCLAVKGNVATFGGRITSSEGSLKKDGLQVGQFVEMTFTAPDGTSGLLLKGSQPATCADDLGVSDTLDPGRILIVDR